MSLDLDFSPQHALASRDRLEEAILRAVDHEMDEFLLGVQKDALMAYGEPEEGDKDSLTASGQRRAANGRFAPGKDPFAFTNVMDRWRKAYRALAADPDMADTGIADLMEASDIPHRLHADVVQVLRKANEEGASNYAVRRRLAALLIPRQRPGQDRENYRASVGAMARNAATTTFNRTAWEQIQNRQMPYTLWLARMDERTRHSHRRLNGTAIPSGTAFRVGSAVIRFPHDPLAPPSETYGCRCVIVGIERPEYTTPTRSFTMHKPLPAPSRLLQFAQESEEECLPCQEEQNLATNFAVAITDDEVVTQYADAPDVSEVPVAEDPNLIPEDPESVEWSGIIGMEGELTGDGRLIEENALEWEDTLPVPLRYVASDVGAHDGAVTIGQVKTVERRDGGVIWATGTISRATDSAIEALGQIERGDHAGVSMDLDSVAFEVRVRSELVKSSTTDAGSVLKENPDGTVTVMSGDPSQEVFVTKAGRLRGLTLVSIPAFAQARIQLTSQPKELVASAGFDSLPDASVFDNPGLTGPTPLKVTSDGRVYGHLATWDSCHIASPTGRACTTAPHSQTGYAYFHTSVMETSDGQDVPVGKLTVNTGHARGNLSAKDTLKHYDHTGSTAAFVRAGEDAHGIWVAGVVSPDASKAQLRALSTSPLSGDWRSIQGNLELVAALSVNVPGFPIPRTSGMLTASGVQSLVAAGMVAPEEENGEVAVDGLSTEDMRYLKKLAQRAREQESAEKAQERAQRREEIARRLKGEG